METAQRSGRRHKRRQWGLSLEFYAGDAAVIGAAFSAIEFDGIRDGARARAYADFSLHLSPTDIVSMEFAAWALPQSEAS
jgi:hypothetical protein